MTSMGTFSLFRTKVGRLTRELHMRDAASTFTPVLPSHWKAAVPTIQKRSFDASLKLV